MRQPTSLQEYRREQARAILLARQKRENTRRRTEALAAWRKTNPPKETTNAQ